ncbi:hypothetical protein QJS66_17540 [Kocuria rhizophila]|nr:hypothetical protein QJS66_17540 [Kocuria rhizophila]
MPTLDGVPNPDGEHRSTVRVSTPRGASRYKDGPLGTAAHETAPLRRGRPGHISGPGDPTVEVHEHRLAAAVPHGPGVRTETYVYAGWRSMRVWDVEESPAGGAPPVR